MGSWSVRALVPPASSYPTACCLLALPRSPTTRAAPTPTPSSASPCLQHARAAFKLGPQSAGLLGVVQAAQAGGADRRGSGGCGVRSVLLRSVGRPAVLEGTQAGHTSGPLPGPAPPLTPQAGPRPGAAPELADEQLGARLLLARVRLERSLVVAQPRLLRRKRVGLAEAAAVMAAGVEWGEWGGSCGRQCQCTGRLAAPTPVPALGLQPAAASTALQPPTPTPLPAHTHCAPAAHTLTPACTHTHCAPAAHTHIPACTHPLHARPRCPPARPPAP